MAAKRRFNQKQIEILRSLCHMNSRQRFYSIKFAEPSLIACICESALNVLKGNVPLKKSQKSRLRKHANVLRNLARPCEKIQKKRAIIQQGGGGFLPALLIPIISTVLSNLIAQ